jgi:tellurite resistance protein TerC
MDDRTRKTFFHERHPLVITFKWAKRIVIIVGGFTVLAVGIAMIVLPGPAFVVIPVGLGILSLEFAWARRWLEKVKERSEALVKSVKKKRGRNQSP